MCSRPPAATRLAWALALILPLAIACGHRGLPKPPPQKIPQPIRDLRVTQRGAELMLSFTYPQTTISGLPIEDIVAIEIWEQKVVVPEFRSEAIGDDDADEDAAAEDEGPEGGDKETTGEAADEGEEGDSEVPAEATAEEGEELAAETPAEETADEDEEPADEAAAEETGEGEAPAEDDEDEDEDEDDEVRAPPLSKETLLEVDPREFAAVSSLRLRLEDDELTRAIKGDKVEVSLPLDTIEPGEKEALVIGVKSFQALDRASAISNLARIIPRVTPDPPADLELEPVANGIKLSWTFEGEEPVEFRLYRRDPLAPEFGEHLGAKEGDGDQFLDSTAEFGQSYVYAMTVVVNRTPLVESTFSSERQAEYLDVFPPTAPTDLVVLSDAGAARLLWEASPEADVDGYLIYRRTGSGAFEQLNERPVRAAEYGDMTAASGRVYAYRVVAVDREGNMSEPTEEVEVRIP